MQKKNRIIYAGFLILSIVSMIISRAGQHIASGLLLCIGAIILYGYYFLRSRSFVDLRALLSLFWVGGEGIAAFQLSKLQTEWSIVTWVCFTGFYLTFLWGYEDMGYWMDRKKFLGKRKRKMYNRRKSMDRLMVCIIAVALISLFSFTTEMFLLGYAPIFAKEVHAYSEFHITGLHYFTVSCMLVHPLTVIYLMINGKIPVKGERNLLIVTNIMALLVAVSCISKFQFLLIVALPAITYLRMNKNINYRKLFLWGSIGVAGVVLVFTFMILRRNYAPGYLNDIFEMKKPDMPMALQYPYMYIANNYANFNCLVEQLPSHTFGLRILFPLFALTGTKFLFPQLVNFPLYVTKTELNTLTIIYDVYYDFGVIGVLLFGIFLGVISYYLTKRIKLSKNPIIYLFYGQIAMYIILSFFSSWFTVPTTWFWLIITGIMYWYIGRGAKKQNRRQEHKSNSKKNKSIKMGKNR